LPIGDREPKNQHPGISTHRIVHLDEKKKTNRRKEDLDNPKMIALQGQRKTNIDSQRFDHLGFEDNGGNRLPGVLGGASQVADPDPGHCTTWPPRDPLIAAPRARIPP
jgi:hypothetical protein